MQELLVWKLLHTAVACSGRNVVVPHRCWPADDEASLLDRLDLLGLRFGSDLLGGADHNCITADEPLDEPMVSTVAGESLIDTIRTEVEVSTITSRAMVVSVRDGTVASVTAHGKIRRLGGYMARCS